MTLKAKLQKLVEKEINKSTTQKLFESEEELEAMGDQDLIGMANQAGIEELIVKDGEGNLSDEARNEIIQSLCNLENSEDDIQEDVDVSPYDSAQERSERGQGKFPDKYSVIDIESGEIQRDDLSFKDASDLVLQLKQENPGKSFLKRFSKNKTNESVVEAELDEAERKVSPYDAHEFLEKNNWLDKDFFTLSSSEVHDLLAYAKEVGYRKSQSAPGSTGRMFFYYITRLADKWKSRDESLDEAYSETNPKIDLYNKSDGKYLASTNWAKTVREAIKGYEDKHPEMKGNVSGALVKEGLDEAPKDGEMEDEDLLNNEDDKENKDIPDEDDSMQDDQEDKEPSEEEPEKITVVVISPELKKDDEDDDDVQGSYDFENKGLINTNEHVEALFSGEELTEDFKEKAKVIFEAALAEHTKSLRNKFVQEFRIRESKIQKKFNSQVQEVKESLIKEQAKLVDGYLSEAVDTWVQENEMVLESNIRTELTEEFIDGLKNLFAESYIEVPAEKFDLIKAQESKIEELEESLKKEKTSNRRNLKEAKRLHCEAVITKQTSDMTEVEKAKFIKLVESVDFDSIEQFERKIKTLKESYTKKAPVLKEKVEEVKANKKIETQVNIVENVESPSAIDQISNALGSYFPSAK